MKWFLFFCTILNFVHLFFKGKGPWVWYLALADSRLAICLALYLVYNLIQFKAIREKAISLIAFVVSSTYFIITFIDLIIYSQGCSNKLLIYSCSIPVALAALSIFLKINYIKVNKSSDVINDQELFYGFIASKDYKNLVWSLFYNLIGGCVLYSQGKVYSYHKFYFQELSENRRRYYIQKAIWYNTHKIIDNNISSKIEYLCKAKVRWDPFKNNCVNTIFSEFGKPKM